jgi:hypothetical protein
MPHSSQPRNDIAGSGPTLDAGHTFDTGLIADVARRHRATPSSGATVPTSVVEADLAVLDRDGYIVMEGLLTPRSARRSARR